MIRWLCSLPASQKLAWAGGGAVLATLGDLGMLYVGNAMRPELGLPEGPAGLLWIGCALGVVGLPLYGVGYAGAVRGDRAPTARVVRWSGAIGGLAGAGVHAYTGWLIHLGLAADSVASAPAQAVASSGPLLLTLWAITGTAMLVASLAFIAHEIRAKRRLEPAMLANPLVLTVTFVLVALPSVWLQAFLLPASPNLAHVVFFLVLLRRERRR